MGIQLLLIIMKLLSLLLALVAVVVVVFSVVVVVAAIVKVQPYFVFSNLIISSDYESFNFYGYFVFVHVSHLVIASCLF